MSPPTSLDLESFPPSLKRILNPENLAVALPRRVSPIHSMIPPTSYDLESFPPSLKRIINPENLAIALPRRVPPIDTLPTELLDEVLSLIEPLTVLDHRDRRWVLTRVCRHWRVLVQARPDFWTSINVVDALYEEVREPSNLLTLSLNLAGNRGLTVTLTGETLSAFLPQFAACSPHIIALFLSSLDIDSVALLQAIQGGLPRLERVTLDGAVLDTSAMIRASLCGEAHLDLSLLPLGLELHSPISPEKHSGISYLVVADPMHLEFLELPSLSYLRIVRHAAPHVETGFGSITDFIRRSKCDLLDLTLGDLFLPYDSDDWVALLELTPELRGMEVVWGCIGDSTETAFSTVVDKMLTALMDALAHVLPSQSYLVPNLQQMAIDVRFLTSIYDYTFFRRDVVVEMLDLRVGMPDDTLCFSSFTIWHTHAEGTDLGRNSGVSQTYKLDDHWVTNYSLCSMFAEADWTQRSST